MSRLLTLKGRKGLSDGLEDVTPTPPPPPPAHSGPPAWELGIGVPTLMQL